MTAAVPYIVGAAAGASVLEGIQGYQAAKQQAGQFEAAAAAADAAAQANYETNKRAGRAAVASELAAAAAGGSLGGSGTDVAETSSRNLMYDAITKRYNELLTGYNYRVQASAAKKSASSYLIKGITGAATMMAGGYGAGVFGGSTAGTSSLVATGGSGSFAAGGGATYPMGGYR